MTTKRERYANLWQTEDTEPNVTQVYNGLIARLRDLEDDFRLFVELDDELQANATKIEIDKLRAYIIKELESQLHKE